MGFNDPWLSCRSDTIAVISEIECEQGNSNLTDDEVIKEYGEKVEDDSLGLITGEKEQYCGLLKSWLNQQNSV